MAPSPTEDSAAGVWGRNQSGPHANPSPRDVTLTLGLRVTVRATGAEGSHHATLPTHKTQCNTEPQGAQTQQETAHKSYTKTSQLGSGGWGKELS